MAAFLLLQNFYHYLSILIHSLNRIILSVHIFIPIFTRWWLFGAYKLLGERNFEFWSIWFLSTDVFLIAIQLPISKYSNQQSTRCIHLLKSGTFAIKQSCTFGSAWPPTTALRGMKYWKNKIGPFYRTLVLGGWPVKTIRVYCSENRTSDQRRNDEQLMKAKRDPVWPDSGPWAPAVWTRALQWKAKGFFIQFHCL